MKEFKANGYMLYNEFIDGKHSEKTKAKITDIQFHGGGVYVRKTASGAIYGWMFCYKLNKQNFTKFFGIKKYGDQAYNMAVKEKERVYKRYVLNKVNKWMNENIKMT